MSRRAACFKSLFLVIFGTLGLEYFNNSFNYVSDSTKELISQDLGMPLVGGGAMTQRSVEDAIKIGFRLFDSAEMYGEHHKILGNALKKSGIQRSRFYLISKLKIEHLTEAQHQISVTKRCADSVTNILKDLETDYIDLLLIHWPGKGRSFKNCKGRCKIMKRSEWPERREWLWKAMENEVFRGRVRNLGVSNFNIKHIEHLISHAKIQPLVNQIERHLLWQDTTLERYCRDRGIHLVAYKPLGGKSTIAALQNNMKLLNLNRKYNKTLSQIALRWSTQRGIPVITSSTSRIHLQENFGTNDFIISDEDMAFLDNLPQLGRTNYQGQDDVD